MRAAEEHSQHNDETLRLLGLLEQKQREEARLKTEEPADGKKVSVAREAVEAARAALKGHATKAIDFVRDYRILDRQSGAELDRFTADYEVAPWTASKLMADKLVKRYDLQEQQPDGTWLPYNAI